MNNTKRTGTRGIVVYIIFMAVTMGIMILLMNGFGNSASWMTDKEAEECLAAEQNIKEIRITPVSAGDGSKGQAVFVVQEGNSVKNKQYFISDVGAFRQKLLAEHPSIPVRTAPLKEESGFLKALPYITMIVLVIGLVIFLMMQASAGNANNKMMNFGRSRAVVADKNAKVTFNDVAGSYEEKEELQELVEFLKNPGRFTTLGALIPKGVLLVGSPGTGKTYLAKAVAGEADVPFLSISGSDFVEMFVGVGASRVRDLFDQAKRLAPCIVFIDEIDAVGRQRGTGLGGGHDEREQTLNQLLVEMDGFTQNQGVIVMAATNRADILDPALLRPGRFDRKIVVNRPDIRERKEVLDIYARNKPLGSDVDLETIAKITAGFTPADLKNLMNEAAILAARNAAAFISMADIQASLIRVGIGAEKKSRRISEKEKRETAYHEVGHAIIQHVLPELDPVHVISIIPTGLAGGYTMSLPSEDEMYISKKKLKAEMVGLLGGRAAEELILNDVTTGASNDIERSSEIARKMVTRYGMSENLGPLQFGDKNEEVFLGREIGHARNYGDRTADEIDIEVKNLVDEAYAQAKEILQQNIDILNRGADLLVEKEKITGEEFAALFAE